ncbi:MAG: porin [Armatimonadota bacterium]|nr:porin [bacterium]MDW8289897.1 porin [Armatimonadota bacterium]
MDIARQWRLGTVVAMGLTFALSVSLYAQQSPLSTERAVRLKNALQTTKQQVAKLRQKSQQQQLLLTSLAPSAEEEGEAVSSSSDILQRLEEIEARLEEMQESIRDIQGWIEGQNESLMVMANDITELKRFRAGNYVQFQYRDTNEPGGTPDAFALRRFRISQTNVVDPRTSMRLTFDVATGTDTLQAQLRDAQLIYDIEPSDVKVGVQLLLGQQPLPLGYELERSSADREFPERTFANRTMFNGERGRGLYLRYGTSMNSLVHIGVWDALTFNDPEQRGRAPGVASRLAVSAGFRLYSTIYDFGISYFAGKRPAFTAGNQTSPEVDRRFLFVDGSYIGLLVPNLFVRAEAMFGKDRVPSTTANPNRTAKDMTAWHVVLGYNLSSRNQLALRYEQFDADRDSVGNTVYGYGAAYIYYINPGARVTAAYEVFFDPSRTPNRYHVTTLRLQFRM